MRDEKKFRPIAIDLVDQFFESECTDKDVKEIFNFIKDVYLTTKLSRANIRSYEGHEKAHRDYEQA